MQRGVGKRQELVKKDSVDLLRHTEEYCVKNCQHPGSLFAKRVVQAREDQISEASSVADLYMQSWKNCLDRIKQLVYEPSWVGDDQFERLDPGSEGSDMGKNAHIGPSDAGAGPLSV